MPIAPYTHDLKGKSGDDIFIVQMPNPLTRKLHGVRFYEGEGRTKYQAKAMMFDESFGYRIILPKGHKGWELASSERAERGEELPEYDLLGGGEEEDE